MDEDIQNQRPDVRMEITQFHTMKTDQLRIIGDMKKMAFGMIRKLDEMEKNLR